MRSNLLATVGVLALVTGAAVGCGESAQQSGGDKPTTVSAAAVLGPSDSPAPRGEPVDGGTLVMDRNLEPQSLDPIGPTDNGSLFALMQIYDQLVEAMPGSLDPKPALATDWTESADGLTWTFTLRPDVKFSDGTPVTVDDVVFSLDRFKSPDDPYSSVVANLRTVAAKGDSQVVLRFSKPNPSLLYNLTLPSASIVSKSAFERLGAQRFAREPVGSGAFAVDGFSPGKELRLKRNEHYWRAGQPYLDEVVMRYLPDDNARILDLESGQSDVSEAIPYSQVASVDSKPDVHVETAPTTGIDTIYVNNGDKILRDVKVRQALGHATPQDQLIRTVYFGNALAANSAIAPGKYVSPSVPPLDYDVAKGKALLREAGYPDGFDLTLSVAGSDTVGKQDASILQDTWGKLGVRVKIAQASDLGALYAKLGKGDYQTALLTNITADVPVEDEFVPYIYGANQNGGNTFYKPSKRTQQIAADVVTNPDEATRKREFAELQRIGMDTLPYIPIAFVRARTGVRDSVQNFRTLPTGWWRLEQVWQTR